MRLPTGRTGSAAWPVTAAVGPDGAVGAPPPGEPARSAPSVPSEKYGSPGVGVPEGGVDEEAGDAGDLRGANQSLVGDSSAAGSPAAASLTSAASVAAGASGFATEPVRWEAPSASGALVASLIGVRITTGGMGREPGMLIRIRVVSVVSVFGSSGSAAGSGVS
ncbi:hypothetical protein ABR738_26555 [Streptomyces sp. Edi4]|uniref:hypothetical protein n=1 Tax=Streptomyces sp. Edi4 TaxID=3162527 RepID=UPI003305C7F8